MTPAEIVRRDRDYYGIPMQTFEINGRKIKTNFDARQYPLWNGNDIPAKYSFPNGKNRPLGFGESMDEAFIKAVEAGWTEIRFVETSTCVRGYHHVYVWCARKEA